VGICFKNCPPGKLNHTKLPGIRNYNAIIGPLDHPRRTKNRRLKEYKHGPIGQQVKIATSAHHGQYHDRRRMYHTSYESMHYAVHHGIPGRLAIDHGRDGTWRRSVQSVLLYAPAATRKPLHGSLHKHCFPVSVDRKSVTGYGLGGTLSSRLLQESPWDCDSHDILNTLGYGRAFPNDRKNTPVLYVCLLQLGDWQQLHHGKTDSALPSQPGQGWKPAADGDLHGIPGIPLPLQPVHEGYHGNYCIAA
jgi:hypothetical protein